MYAIAMRLSGEPEVWRELRYMGKPLTFASHVDADTWMRRRFADETDGVPHRWDTMHGRQPLKVVRMPA